MTYQLFYEYIPGIAPIHPQDILVVLLLLCLYIYCKNNNNRAGIHELFIKHLQIQCGSSNIILVSEFSVAHTITHCSVPDTTLKLLYNML